MEFYESLNQAVLAALTEAQAAAKGRRGEAGGIIFQTEDGRYHYSRPENRLSRGGDGNFRSKVAVPAGSRPVAVYHNHPKQARDHLFSPADTETAIRLGLPSYIIGHDGVTRRFVPGQHETLRHPRGAAEGEIVDLNESAEQVSALLGAVQ